MTSFLRVHQNLIGIREGILTYLGEFQGIYSGLMESTMVGGSVNRPPILDGTNYDYWKARMVVFLKSTDSKIWKAIVKGWKHPVVASTSDLKPEEKWTKKEDEEALANNKVLNVIFNGVDKNIFRLIYTCTVAKDAWEILKTTHEGTSRVRMSKLQLLTTKFEKLRMTEYESIGDFYMRVRDLANTSFDLGEQIPEEKLVRKILRSLPKKFDMKVTVIEEAHDISKMKVDELIGSLQTFEMAINDRTEDAEDQNEEDIGESPSETIACLCKALERLNKMSRPNVIDIQSDICKNSDFQHNRKCEDVTANRVTSLTVKCSAEDESSDEDMSDQELAETYKLMYVKLGEASTLVAKQKKIISNLIQEKEKLLNINAELQEEVSLLNSKLEGMNESLRMLNNGSNILDEILKDGKKGRSMKWIGFDYKSTSEEGKNTAKMFVSPEKQTEFLKQTEFQMSDNKSQQVVQHVYTKSQNLKNSTWRCHYCGMHGHIRPYCYRLHRYPQSHGQSRINTQSVQARKQWIPRGNNGEVLMKGVAPLQSHSSTDDVTKKRMKYVAKKKKSTKNVVQETEVQVENVVEETDVADDDSDIGSPVKRKACGKKLPVNVLPNGEVIIRTMWHPLSNCAE